MDTNDNYVTPVLYVEEIEPCLDFMKRLGFKVHSRSRQGKALSLVVLEKDGAILMYQSRAGLKNGMPPLARGLFGQGFFTCINVPDLDKLEISLMMEDVIVPRREAFYGNQEIFVRDPAGNAIVFAQQI